MNLLGLLILIEWAIRCSAFALWVVYLYSGKDPDYRKIALMFLISYLWGFLIREVIAPLRKAYYNHKFKKTHGIK